MLLNLIFIFVTYHIGTQGHPKNLAWNGGPLHLKCEHGADLWVRSGQHLPENVIATKALTFKDDIYVITPRMKHGILATLWLIVREKHTVELQPYPELRTHNLGDCSTVQNAVDVFMDHLVKQNIVREPACLRVSRRCVKFANPHWPSVVDYGLNPLSLRGGPCPTVGQILNRGNLWILDTGVIDTLTSPRCTCPPKVVEINLLLGKVIKTIEISSISEPTSLLQNIVVEYGLGGKIFIYVSDASRGSVLVHEVSSASGWSVPTCMPSTGLQIALVKKVTLSVLIVVRLHYPGLLELDTAALRRKTSCAPLRIFGEHSKPVMLLGTDVHHVFLRHMECSDVLSWDTRDAYNDSRLDDIHSAGPRLTPTSVAGDSLKNVLLVLDSNYGDTIHGSSPTYHKITFI